MRPLLSIMLFSLAFQSVWADWDYQSEDAMIANSEAIAIVTVGKVEKTATNPEEAAHVASRLLQGNSSRQYDTYHEKASATVEKVLKGKVPAKIEIYGEGEVICGPDRFARLKSGRCLLFLKRVGNILVPNNADLGIRPIEHEQIDWYGKSAYDRKDTQLANVLKNIQAQLSLSKATKKKR